MMVEKKKRCSKCGDEKTLDKFYNNRVTYDGKSNYCIDCTKEITKEYSIRKKSKEKINETEIINKMVDITLKHKSNRNTMMRVLMLEEQCKMIMNEIELLKKEMVNSEKEHVQALDLAPH